MVRLNVLLFTQSAVVTTAVAPAGMSSGEWFALGALLLTIGGVLYRAGIASQKAAAVESLVAGALKELTDKVDAILEGQVDRARFEENVEGRLGRLEGSPIHVHQRASDR